MLQAFDDLMLLTEGNIVYLGPADAAVDHFSAIGYSCPPRMNPGKKGNKKLKGSKGSHTTSTSTLIHLALFFETLLLSANIRPIQTF